MYRIDLHVHTKRYSPCAELLDPERLPAQMRICGLHGLVITEHNELWSADEIARLQNGQNGIHIYRGVEVSTSGGHFVVIGIQNIDDIQSGMSIEDLIAKTRHDKAAIILAHHHMAYSNTRNPINPVYMPKGIHAIEVASTATKNDKTQEACCIADLKGWVKVAGSDAHSLEHVGAAYTLFDRMPEDEKALANAIRKGKGIPIQGSLLKQYSLNTNRAAVQNISIPSKINPTPE